MGNPHEGHRERVRRRFFEEGLEHFAPHEVLEYLLFFTIAQGDTNVIAHRLMEHFGSLTAVLEASYDALLEVEGIGPKSALLLCSVPSLSRVYLEDTLRRGAVLDTPKKMEDFLRPRFLGAREEQFYLICLDSRRCVLDCRRLNKGAIDRVHVDMRSILEIVLRTGATAIILAHNHPAQFAVPSSDDLAVTRYIASVLNAVSVKVLDHFVFSRDECVSMRETGYFVAIEEK